MSNSPDVDEILLALKSGCIQTCSRLISRIERGDATMGSLLGSIYRASDTNRIIGVTGPPGAGKSSLVNQLVHTWRRQNMRVAVLAVDPSSPFSGGAILGDRFRMSDHTCDESVYIRSMAARGQMGGLAKAAGDALTILSAMPWDFLVVETVGVGQSETDIMRYASAILLVQTPMGGDDVQAAKAGINEIGDVYVVNKSDHPEADRAKAQLEDMLTLGHTLAPTKSWRPQVIKTQSLDGSGIDLLVEEIEKFFSYLEENIEFKEQRFREGVRQQVRDIALDQIAKRIRDETNILDKAAFEEVMIRKSDPYALADSLLNTATGSQH